MEQNRREFLKAAAGVSAATLAAGCGTDRMNLVSSGGPMCGFAVPPMKEIKVGIIGVGARGSGAARRLPFIPGVRVTALCDIQPNRVDGMLAWYKKNGKPDAKRYVGGPDEWKRLCDDPDVDVIYSVTPRELHGPINVYGLLNSGKHVLQEVPGAFTIEECWATVEAAEKAKRHCFLLENSPYGEFPMLAHRLVHEGLLGDIIHVDSAYIHDQRKLQYKPNDGRFWRIKRHQTHHGNYYPTHPTGCTARYLNINHGDKFDFMVSMESMSGGFERFGRDNFPASDWRHGAKMVKGDMNTSMIRTANGKSIMLQHCVSMPHPYDRINQVWGTLGVFRQFPDYKVVFEEKAGSGNTHGYFPDEKAEEIRKKYMNPMWKKAGALAKTVGGHGGTDYIMDLRWAYCLQNGLPLDTNVYDLASWSAIVELSERSVNAGSRPMEFPDFTRGAWKTTPAFGIPDVDLAKVGDGKFGNLIDIKADDQLT